MNKIPVLAGAFAALAAAAGEGLRAFSVYDLTPDQADALNHAFIAVAGLAVLLIGHGMVLAHADGRKTAARVNAAASIATAHPQLVTQSNVGAGTGTTVATPMYGTGTTVDTHLTIDGHEVARAVTNAAARARARGDTASTAETPPPPIGRGYPRASS